MSLPRMILCPVDFSDCSARALDRATALAAALDAKIHVLYVHELLPYSLPDSVYGARDFAATLQSELLAKLRLLATHAGPHLERSQMIVQGIPHREIVRVATELPADLIVMGTHGRSGAPRWLLGSVAERVVRTSPVPVMTVPGDGM